MAASKLVCSTHNSSYLADCISSPSRLPSDHIREYVESSIERMQNKG